MKLTVFEPAFTTRRSLPSGVRASSWGRSPWLSLARLMISPMVTSITRPHLLLKAQHKPYGVSGREPSPQALFRLQSPQRPDPTLIKDCDIIGAYIGHIPARLMIGFAGTKAENVGMKLTPEIDPSYLKVSKIIYARFLITLKEKSVRAGDRAKGVRPLLPRPSRSPSLL